MLTAGHRVFVLNLADVPYIDSFGLGQLIAIWISIAEQSGQMTLLRPTDHVRKLFQITKLDTVFHLSEKTVPHELGLSLEFESGLPPE